MRLTGVAPEPVIRVFLGLLLGALGLTVPPEIMVRATRVIE